MANMKPVKSYEEFKKELHESKKVDESIVSTIKKGLQKIGEFFRGIGSSFLNALIIQAKERPKGVKYYPNKADMDILTKAGIKAPLLSEIKESVNIEGTEEQAKEPEEKPVYESFDQLTEAVVPLLHPNKDIPNIGVKEFKAHIEDLIFAGQKGKEPGPLLIWGAPGIGKTEIIAQVAKEADFTRDNCRLIEIDLQTWNPEDFFLPSVDQKTGKQRRNPANWVAACCYELGAKGESESNKTDEEANGVDGRGGIIYFDELARCKSSVQDIIMKLCDSSRRVDTWKLGSKWVIVASANRKFDQGSENETFRFSAILGNRFQQYNFSPKFQDWAEWADTAVDKNGKRIVTQDIVNFIRFNEKWFHLFDPDITDESGAESTIFPSPRTWEKASKNLTNRQEKNAEKGKSTTMEEMEEIIAGAVGTAAASAFIGFLRLLKKVDMKEIDQVYKDGAKARKLDGLNIDEQNAYLVAVATRKQGKEVNVQELESLGNWLVGINHKILVVKFLKAFSEIHQGISDTENFQDTVMTKVNDAYGEDLTKNR